MMVDCVVVMGGWLQWWIRERMSWGRLVVMVEESFSCGGGQHNGVK